MSPEPGIWKRITPGEFRVLVLRLLFGCTRKEIAHALGISTHTIRGHMRNAKLKFAVPHEPNAEIFMLNRILGRH